MTITSLHCTVTDSLCAMNLTLQLNDTRVSFLTVVDLCCTVTTCLYAAKFDLQNHIILYDSCVLTVYCDEDFISYEVSFTTDCAA